MRRPKNSRPTTRNRSDVTVIAAAVYAPKSIFGASFVIPEPRGLDRSESPAMYSHNVYYVKLDIC